MLPRILPKDINPTTVFIQYFFNARQIEDGLQDVVNQIIQFYNIYEKAWPGFVNLITEVAKYYNEKGEFPRLEGGFRPSPVIEKRKLRIVKGSNLRSEPTESSKTFMALMSKVPADVDAEDKEVNGYVPVTVWVYKKNTKWI